MDDTKVDEAENVQGDIRVILTRVNQIRDDVGDIKADMKAMNGTVRTNSLDIAVLKETCLRLSAIKLSAIIGGVVLVVMALFTFLNRVLEASWFQPFP